MNLSSNRKNTFDSKDSKYFLGIVTEVSSRVHAFQLDTCDVVEHGGNQLVVNCAKVKLDLVHLKENLPGNTVAGHANILGSTIVILL